MEDKNETNTTTPVVNDTDTGEVFVPSEGVVDEAVAETAEVTIPASPELVEVAAATPVDVVAEAAEADTVVVAEVSNGETIAAVANVRSAMLKQYGIALGIIIVMGAGVTYALEQQGRINTHIFAKVNELVHPTPVAAIVNGVKISMADYEKSKAQLEQTATQSGADITNDSIKSQIKTQALDVLINTEILKQAATKDGITVTDEQIKGRYDDIVKSVQGEDKLEAKMTELGITKESLMKDIAAELLIQAYLAKSVDTSSIKIEEKDIKAAYDQANTNPDSPLPPLAQVHSAVETKLRQDREQQLINDYIQKLRDSAKIETKI